MQEYKPTSSYRMSRQAKQMLSRIQDPIERTEAKRLIIQSELHLQLTPKRNPLDKDRAAKNSRNTKEDDTTEE
jgi:hypothetical protein